MKQKYMKKIGSFMLAGVIVLTMFPTFHTEVHAAENQLPTKEQFASIEELKQFNTEEKNKSVKVIFGNNNHKWWIAGSQSNDSIVLFATSPLKENVPYANVRDGTTKLSYDSSWGCSYISGSVPNEVFATHYGSSNIRNELKKLESTYFTSTEQMLMKDTKIYINDTLNENSIYYTTDKLYLAFGDNEQNHITVGQNSSDNLGEGLIVNYDFWLTRPSGEKKDFYLRNPVNKADIAVAWSNGKIGYDGYLNKTDKPALPAFSLDLSNVLFASFIPAVSDEGSISSGDAFVLRYNSQNLGSALVSYDKSKVILTSVPEDTYLVVQNSNGAWAKQITNETEVSASDMSLANFNNCKVWLETTDINERMTYATLATEEQGYNVNIVANEGLTVINGMQDVASGSAITEITVEVDKGYYLPEGYINDIQGLNGLNVEETDRGLKIFGTPTSDVTVTLPAANVKKGDSEIKITTESLNKIYDGIAVISPTYTTSGSDGEVKIKWQKKAGTTVESKWEDLDSAPSDAGSYRVVVELAGNSNYNSASANLEFTIYEKKTEVTENNKDVTISTDKIEINTEKDMGQDKDVYLYCTESEKVPAHPVISSKFRIKVDEWEKVTESEHVFTGLKPNTKYHIWKYDDNKPEGEKLTYEYSIKTDAPSTPSIPSKPEEKPGIGVKIDVVDKIAGEDRYDTSVSISQKVFSSKSEKVYLVSGEKFPDALSSAALTGKGDGPILLINDKNVDKILAEIDRLDAKEIVFIGGNSISDANEAKIRKFAKENSSTVRDFVGEDRYETAVKVAEETISKYGNKGKVIIADGRNYPDAVSIASYAAKEGIPVILVNGNKVPDVVKNLLNKYKINSAIIVGGDKAVGKDVEKLFKSVDRVAGVDRYDTSKKIAEKFFASSNIVFVASGESFADSLSVSYYAGAKNAPILLTKSNSLDNDTREYLEKNKNKDYIIVGGDKAVNPDLFK